jgi:hypothetical protein
VIGKIEMLGGLEDDGEINLISRVACLANLLGLQVGVEDKHKRMSEQRFDSIWCWPVAQYLNGLSYGSTHIQPSKQKNKMTLF